MPPFVDTGACFPALNSGDRTPLFGKNRGISQNKRMVFTHFHPFCHSVCGFILKTHFPAGGKSR
jgi:hypothetical protein